MGQTWFKFFPTDWLSDRNNAGLTLEELGAHIQLLCLMWDSDDCSVPDDDQWVARQLRIPVSRWRKLRAVLVDSPMAVLRREDLEGKSVLFSPKLREIFADFRAQAEKKRAAARKRWSSSEGPETASWRDSGDADALQTDCTRISTCNADADAPASNLHMQPRRKKQDPEPDFQENPPTLSSPDGEDPSPPPAEGGGPDGVAGDAGAMADAVVAAWNAIAPPTLPRVVALTPQRRAKIQARCRGHPDRTPEWWAGYFQRIVGTPFLRGDNSRGWRATFDWALQSEQVVARVWEGAYDRAASNGRARDAPGASRFARNLAAIRQGLEEEGSP
jgi:uncharacterized protein YdaU (DUF1376 family)